MNHRENSTIMTEMQDLPISFKRKHIKHLPR